MNLRLSGNLLTRNTLLNFIGQAAKGLHKPLTKLDMRKVKIQGLIPKMTYSGNLGISLGKTSYLLKELAKKGLLKAKNFTRREGKIKKVKYILTKARGRLKPCIEEGRVETEACHVRCDCSYCLVMAEKKLANMKTVTQAKHRLGRFRKVLLGKKGQGPHGRGLLFLDVWLANRGALLSSWLRGDMPKVALDCRGTWALI